MTTIWICEKPSQARDIAAVLGKTKSTDTSITTQAGIVTWARGHLFEEFAPEDYDDALKRWTMETLPIVPETWRNSVKRETAAQLRAICELLKTATGVVIATDADREGEAIGREILVHARYRGPVKRLWLSALDPESVRRAVNSLRDGSEKVPLYWAAQARTRADWLVGMNLTRAATLIAQGAGAEGVRSVGRVQTPTLALVVRRDAEIEGFEPRQYFEIEADVDASGTPLLLRYAPSGDARLFDRASAERIAAQVIGASGPLQVTTERKRQGPPGLLSLRKLQKACSKRFGFGADKTLEVAQSLYETHKILSYPRSDCEFMPNEQEGDIPSILAHLVRLDGIGPSAQRAATAPVIRQSVWNSAKTTAHHAIVPTLTPASLDALDADERRVYLLVAQHYIASLSPDYLYDQTRVVLDANGVPLSATSNTQVSAGWKAVMQEPADDDDASATSTRALPALVDGTPSQVILARVDGKVTEPPQRYTEGTLIEDMSAIAKFCTDPRVKARLKETSGIGTSATQANIIKTLRNRGFIAKHGRNAIVSTPAGRALIAFLPPELSDPALTALWEDRLAELADGKLPEAARDDFVARVAEQVRSLLSGMRAAAPPDMSGDAGAGGGRKRQASRNSRRSETRSDPPARDGAPTEKMVAYARSIAQSKGLRELPENVTVSFVACKAFIDEHGGEMAKNREAGKPSPRAVEYAQSIANKMGMLLPNDVRTSADACRHFLDTYSTNAGRGRA